MHYKEIRRIRELQCRVHQYERVLVACKSLFDQGVSISYTAIARWLGLKNSHFYQAWVQPNSSIRRVVHKYQKLQMELSAA